MALFFCYNTWKQFNRNNPSFIHHNVKDSFDISDLKKIYSWNATTSFWSRVSEKSNIRHMEQ